jgi:CRISPR-associated protein (TIGR03986 family)
MVKKNTLNAENYMPCKDKDKLCPACSLFGTVVEDENNLAVASRIRFSDAVFCGDSKPQYHDPVAISELANPKFRCFEFYMTHLDKDLTGLTKAFDLESGDVTIKGRKFYLHHKPGYTPVEPSKLNCTIRPLTAGENSKFKFSVFFDKISEKELQQLLVVLSNGGNNEENLCHKIGKAKPLGFGSVKIKVKDVFVRNIKKAVFCLKDFAENKTKDYADYFSNKNKWEEVFKTDGSVIESYKVIADMNTTKGQTVSYPKAINFEEKDEALQKASYQWFIGNRRIGPGGKEMDWVSKYPLPSILDGSGNKKCLELPALVKREVTAPNNQGNNRNNYNNYRNNNANYGNRRG